MAGLDVFRFDRVSTMDVHEVLFASAFRVFSLCLSRFSLPYDIETRVQNRFAVYLQKFTLPDYNNW